MRACTSTLLLAVALCCSPALGDDWPMLGHDPGRSGATSDEVRPPFERKWYRAFPDEGLMAGVQPVVARGRLFIGTLRGTLHAIDAETGEDLWTRQAGGPILHACEAGHRRVFFTCADSPADKVSEGGGLTEEGEDIDVVETTLEEAVAMIETGEIVDAKTVVLVQYLSRRMPDVADS